MVAFSKEDTFNKIADMVAEKLSIDKSSIKLSSTFQDLGADSLDMVEIIMKLEEQCGLEIKDEDAEKMCTMQDVVDYVTEHRTK